MDFSKKLSSLKQSHLYRSRKISENAQNTQLIINAQNSQLIINGQSLINFCSDNHLNKNLSRIAH
jgi:8-amino-7-oxononanoate synthase